jgi:hypothetical protein
MKKLRKFKLCNKCNKELSFNKFRERKDTGWKDINYKFRYSYCRECEKKRFKEAYKKDPIPQMLSNSKIRAKAKKLPHNITSDDIREVWPKDNICPVLKKPFEMGFKSGKTKSMAPSLDKIIPSKGYTKDNIVVISDIVNRLKSDASLEDLKKIINFYIKK